MAEGAAIRPGALLAADAAALFLLVGVEPCALLGEALAQLVHLGEVLLGLRGLDVVADLDFELGDLALVQGLEVGQLGLLGLGEDLAGGLSLQAFHREFVGGFHGARRADKARHPGQGQATRHRLMGGGDCQHAVTGFESQDSDYKYF